MGVIAKSLTLLHSSWVGGSGGVRPMSNEFLYVK